jgi:serine/threonine-protein kinase
MFGAHCRAVIGTDQMLMHSQLGEGAFGAVYSAFDPNSDLVVAQKIPRPGVVTGFQSEDRFLLEARATVRLNHRSIVCVYDAGRVGKKCYISNQMIVGKTLETFLERQSRPMVTERWSPVDNWHLLLSPF